MESVEHFDWLSLGSRPRDMFTRYPLAKVIHDADKELDNSRSRNSLLFFVQKVGPTCFTGSRYTWSKEGPRVSGPQL